MDRPGQFFLLFVREGGVEGKSVFGLNEPKPPPVATAIDSPYFIFNLWFGFPPAAPATLPYLIGSSFKPRAWDKNVPMGIPKVATICFVLLPVWKQKSSMHSFWTLWICLDILDFQQPIFIVFLIILREKYRNNMLPSRHSNLEPCNKGVQAKPTPTVVGRPPVRPSHPWGRGGDIIRSAYEITMRTFRDWTDWRARRASGDIRFSFRFWNGLASCDFPKTEVG